MPDPVMGLPDQVMPVALATATLVTVPPPPPPEGGAAHDPSPRRYVVESGVPEADISETVCECELAALLLSALCKSVWLDSVPVMLPHAVVAEMVVQVPSPRRNLVLSGVPVAFNAVTASCPVRSSVTLPAARVRVRTSVAKSQLAPVIVCP